jgi:hypothetical protein
MWHVGYSGDRDIRSESKRSSVESERGYGEMTQSGGRDYQQVGNGRYDITEWGGSHLSLGRWRVSKHQSEKNVAATSNNTELEKMER